MAKILVVDDEEGILRSMRRCLEDNGYEVITASSSQEALRLLAEQKPDLILTDFILGFGDDAFKILDAKPECSVIVMSSAFPDATLAHQLERAGAASAFRKGDSISLLLSLVRESIR